MLSYLFYPVTGFLESVAWLADQLMGLLHAFENKDFNVYAMVIFIGVVSIFRRRKIRVYGNQPAYKERTEI